MLSDLSAETIADLKVMPVFGKICFPTALKAGIPPFHFDLYDDLANPMIHQLLIAAPRGTAKSTVADLVYPMYLIAWKKPEEDIYIVLVSEAEDQAKDFLARIKYHLDNSVMFRKIFGDLGSKTAHRWTNTDIILANGVRIRAVGTGQKIRGRLEKDTRPTHIICDDFESETNSKTWESRLANRKWLLEAVQPSLADNGKLVVIGTVIHEDCFLLYAKESPEWTKRWYSIIKEDGTSLWPERFPMTRINAIRRQFDSMGNSSGFYQEYMNIPQSPEDQIFKPEFMCVHSYISYDNKDPYLKFIYHMQGDQIIKVPVYVTMGVDLNAVVGDRNDYFVIYELGTAYDENRYTIDIYEEKLSPEKHPDKVFEYYKRYRPDKVRMDAIQYQDSLRHHVKALMEKENIWIPGIDNGSKSKTNKQERLASMAPVFKNGLWHFRHCDERARQQFMAFPKNKHDDIMDAAYYAWEVSKPSRAPKAVENVVDRVQEELNWKIM
jgi:predicted phage terminase large subunit-like protein